MKCPKCEDQQLLPTQIGRTEVDRCEQCKGAWFDAREIEAVLQEDPRTLKPISGGKARGLDGKSGRCPRDGMALARVFSSRDGVTVIDVCLTCGGIWLDAGEIEALRKAES